MRPPPRRSPHSLLSRLAWGFAALVGLTGGGLAWRVRLGHANAPAGHYELVADGVRDKRTGLVWGAVDGGVHTWQAALGVCSAMGGSWRLPGAAELATLVDHTVPFPGPMIDARWFASTPNAFFWSSTPYAGSAGKAWGVAFDTGYTNFVAVASTGRARCVR
jgi:hypothetical protein